MEAPLSSERVPSAEKNKEKMVGEDAAGESR